MHISCKFGWLYKANSICIRKKLMLKVCEKYILHQGIDQMAMMLNHMYEMHLLYIMQDDLWVRWNNSYLYTIT